MLGLFSFYSNEMRMARLLQALLRRIEKGGIYDERQTCRKRYYEDCDKRCKKSERSHHSSVGCCFVQYHDFGFTERGYATLNELYEFLGLEPTDYGNTVGWAVEDELYWIDFHNHKVLIDDDMECYIIETPWGPSPDFLEYYY